jgi:hypothetical protein
VRAGVATATPENSMNARPRLLAVALGAMLLAPALTVPAQAQPREPVIYGSQLMTQQERLEYRERLRNAHTVQEREQIRLQHHREMQERARERGVTLPDAPRRSIGPGPGPGAGPRGSGMGAGMGPGGGMGGGAGGGAGGGSR